MNLCIVIKSYPWYHQLCGLQIWFICLIFCKLGECSPGVKQSKLPFPCQLPNQQIRSVFLKCSSISDVLGEVTLQKTDRSRRGAAVTFLSNIFSNKENPSHNGNRDFKDKNIL